MNRLALVALTLMTAALSAQTPWSAEYCVGCHSAQRKIGGLSLAGFNVDNAEVVEKVILKLRAGMMPPPGSRRPAKAELDTIVEALESKMDSAAAVRPNPGWRPFQRLNRSDYGRAIHDLLGLDVDVTALLPADTVSGGFDNIADVQTFSPILMTGYLRAAGQIARLAVTNPKAKRLLFTCRPAAPSRETGCAQRILQAVTTAAYRGTATPKDLEDALAFFKKGRDGASFDNGIRLALQSILMSPRFLFRLESPMDSTLRVSDAALASRLSYFIWGAAPDIELAKAAASGALRTPKDFEKQVRRLLADRNSEALSRRFATQWLRLQDLDKVIPDDALFPKYTSEIAKLMRRETELFFDSVVREDRNVMDLFNARYSYWNEALAKHYGVAGIAGSAFRRVPVPDERRGLLGQGSVLMSTSLSDRTSPVLRGKWILEVLFGTPPPPPPPNVPSLDETARAVRGEKTFSTRQRIEEHRRNPACSSCHKVIDPPGIALENFDATGAWRTSDNKVLVDALGELYDGTKMQGPSGLRDALSAHQDLVLRNLAERMMTYATGRRMEASDMPAIRAIVNGAAKDGNRFSSFVLGVANSAAFQMNQPPLSKAQ